MTCVRASELRVATHQRRNEMNSPTYHLQELAIARAPTATGHLLPANVPDRARILDIGCGAGQTLIALGPGSGRTVVGIDIDAEALRLGQALTGETRFVCGRAESLPFGRDSFDFVIARVALPYTDVPQAVAEIGRVLSVGAACWLVLHPVSLAWRQLLGHLRRLQLKGTLYQLYVIANGVALHLFGRQFRFPLRRDRIESFQTSRGIRRALRAAGLVNVELHRGHFFVVTARKASPSRRRRSASKGQAG
jgi:SAM-dependent methyltransferase